MSDASILTQINEPGVFGPLGPQANPNAPEVNPTAAEGEEDLFAPTEETGQPGDVVELSDEGLRLAQAQEEGLNTEEVTAGAAETETNAGENQLANAAPTGVGAVEVQEPTTTGIAPEEPETGDLGIPPEDFNEDLAQERLTAANAANPVGAQGTVESGIGATIEPETEPTSTGALETEPEPVEENPNGLLSQANELFQFNTIFAQSNGLPNEAPTAENTQAPENTQNQQQVILNELSSQLAQAVPPATIFSVVG